MADDPVTTDAKPKGKGGSLLKGKIAGIPKPVLLLGVGVLAFVGYKYWKDKQSAASTSSTATPTDSTGTGDDGGGYQGGGGGGGQYTPPATTTPGTTPTTPTGTNATPAITPIGAKTIDVNGQSFSGVSSFVDNANGATYYGIDNPTEAKKLEAMGASLVHNPNDPNGKGLFLMVPAGSSPTATVDAKNTKFTQAQNAADTKPATKTAADVSSEQTEAAKSRAAAAAKTKAQQTEAKKLATAKVKARG